MKTLSLTLLLLFGLWSSASPRARGGDDEKGDGRPKKVGAETAPIKSETIPAAPVAPVAPINSGVPAIFEGDAWIFEMRTDKGTWIPFYAVPTSKQSAKTARIIVQRLQNESLAKNGNDNKESWRVQKRKIRTTLGKEWKANLKFLDGGDDFIESLYPTKKEDNRGKKNVEMGDF